jgi:hypothetical protein
MPESLVIKLPSSITGSCFGLEVATRITDSSAPGSLITGPNRLAIDQPQRRLAPPQLRHTSALA